MESAPPAEAAPPAAETETETETCEKRLARWKKERSDQGPDEDFSVIADVFLILNLGINNAVAGLLGVPTSPAGALLLAIVVVNLAMAPVVCAHANDDNVYESHIGTAAAYVNMVHLTYALTASGCVAFGGDLKGSIPAQLSFWWSLIRFSVTLMLNAGLTERLMSV